MSSSPDSAWTVPPSQAAATSIIAILFFLLACIEGNSRILRVIDSRRQIVVRRTAQYFATQNYNTQQQQKSQSNLGSGGANNTNAAGTSPRRTNSLGSAAHRQAGALELQPLLTDNRFLLGVVAASVGVLRSAYVLSVLFLQETVSNGSGSGGNGSSSSNTPGTNGTHSPHRHIDPFHRKSATSPSTSMTGQTVVSDLITLPLAVLSYSLVLAVLWAHRDLMTKIRKAYDPDPPASEHPEFPQNPLPPTVPGSNNNRNNNTKSGSLSNLNRNNSNSKLNQFIGDGRKNSGGSNMSTETPPSATTTAAVTINGGGISALANNGSFDEKKPMLSSPSSIPSSSQQQKSCLESDFYLKFIRPYRAVLTMSLVGFILAAAFVIELITENVKVSEYCSPVISIFLGLWSLYSTVESYIRLRFFGAASRRVIVAILILTIYLLVRGIVILPPVQDKLCAEDDDGVHDYWRCFFAYSSVDALGMFISLIVLP